MRVLGISQHFDRELEKLEKNTKDDKSITKASNKVKNSIRELDEAMAEYCSLYPNEPECIKWRKHGLDYIHNMHKE
jgi:restriction endonuclease